MSARDKNKYIVGKTLGKESDIDICRTSSCGEDIEGQAYIPHHTSAFCFESSIFKGTHTHIRTCSKAA